MSAPRAVVTPAEVTAFLQEAFRNVALPPLGRHDFDEIHTALARFAQQALDKAAGL